MDKQYMKLSLIFAALLMAGCATGNDWHWEKPRASHQDFAMDSGQCRAQALSGTGGFVSQGTVMIMYSCLEGKGWQRIANR